MSTRTQLCVSSPLEDSHQGLIPDLSPKKPVQGPEQMRLKKRRMETEPMVELATFLASQEQIPLKR